LILSAREALAMIDPTAKSTATVTEIVRQLIDEYAATLHLPDGRVAALLVKQTKLTKNTVLAILGGRTKQINENTRRQLAEFFNRVVAPPIQPDWFLSGSLKEFNARRASSLSIPLTMPVDYHKKVAALDKWLCGVHIVYRYSLEFIDTGDVAREVIHVWNNGAFLEFAMSFVNQSGGAGRPVFYFRGPVFAVGRSVILFGMNIGPNSAEREYDRVRVIVLDHDNAGGDTRNCKIGLMTSTRPRRDNAPCTASTILIRTEWDVPDPALGEFVETATIIRPLDEMINSDFGEEHGALFKVFLDNRLLGCTVEPEMEPYVKLVPRPDRVLRLDTERFATHMSDMLMKVSSNNAIRSPFKKNWISTENPIRAMA
jgi:hypothetical protein